MGFVIVIAPVMYWFSTGGDVWYSIQTSYGYEPNDMPAVVVLLILIENCPAGASVTVMPPFPVESSNGVGVAIVILIEHPVKFTGVELIAIVNAKETSSPCANAAFNCCAPAEPVTETWSMNTTYSCESQDISTGGVLQDEVNGVVR